MKRVSGNSAAYLATGLMSGTSLDGLDLAACRFRLQGGRWEYSFIATETIDYSAEWRNKLSHAPALSSQDLTRLDREYGDYLGLAVREFHKKHQFIPDFVASHGHTIFHQPGKRFTLQIGHGTNLAVAAGIPAITDFRSTDVAHGGQGAPLVPAGDQHLFGEYASCLNLGGFANISYQETGVRKAGDICPVNIILNHLAAKKGMNYDDQGQLGAAGVLNLTLSEALNSLAFYQQPFPRSLGREWVEEHMMPLLEKFPDTPENHARTLYDHISQQIARYLIPGTEVLVTGGGTYNDYLFAQLQEKSGASLIKPADVLVCYKEALIFAFLGVLRWRNEVNCFASVTGASRDSCAGAIYLPQNGL